MNRQSLAVLELDHFLRWEVDRIRCGDSAKLHLDLRRKSVDLVVTSPPYDAIRDYEAFRCLDLVEVGHEISRVLRDVGVCVWIVQDQTANFAKSLTSFRAAVRFCDKVGFRVYESYIYQRSGFPGPRHRTRFRTDHEYIFMFLKGDRPSHFDKSHLTVEVNPHAYHGTERQTDGSLKRTRVGVVGSTTSQGTIFRYATSSQERAHDRSLKLKHPATMPDRLAEDMIRTFTLPGMIVLDPFLGSGTTAVAAKKLGRRFVGIDVAESYCEIACQRLERTG